MQICKAKKNMTLMSPSKDSLAVKKGDILLLLDTRMDYFQGSTVYYYRFYSLEGTSIYYKKSYDGTLIKYL